ncbi:MAG TPA: EamA family transporter [Candidatus Baltobacteraceae bacterium]|jgi:drug/metabolite transporter (DMT)-like permease|nr:EamA family transporter [Candidatus Baltobacteraceae bacterium]
MSSVAQPDGREASRGLLPWISLVIVWLVWGSTFLGIRVAVQSIPPLLMTGSRYMVAGALLCAFAWVTQRGRRITMSRRELKTVLITAVLLLVVGNGLLSIAEIHLQSGTAALLVATVPLWMIVADAVLARKLQAASAAGIVLGTAGVIALAGAPSAHESPISAGMVLFGALSWAVGSVYARRNSNGHSGAFAIGVEMFAAGTIMCAIGALTGEVAQLHAVPAVAVAAWLWLVIAGATIAYSAYSYAVRTLPTNIVATYAYVNPVVAVLLGAALLREPITLNIILGGAAIVMSVVAIVAGNRPAVSQTAQVQEAA